MSAPPNPITVQGYRRLREEYDELYGVARPKLLEIIAWAASNGDLSENADYHYGRKRLREVDRRINFLARRMGAAQIVDPAAQPDRDKVWFGATVTVADENDARRTVTLVGEDEADAESGRISFRSPLGRALRGASVGDLRRVELPSGEKEYEVMEIAYPAARMPYEAPPLAPPPPVADTDGEADGDAGA